MRRLVVLLLLVAAALTVPSAGALAQDGEGVGGTLRGPDGEPVAGVMIRVEQDGREIGTAATGPDGSWQVPVPGPGNYDVTLDTATLPPDVALRDAGAATLPDVTVRPGQQRTVLFPIVSAEDAAPGVLPGPPPVPAGPSTAAVLAQLTIAGIKFGAIIAITAIGPSLIFGTTNLINFAHGEMVTIGAMAAFFLNAATLGPGWDLIPSALIAILIGALVGAALERGLWRPLRIRGTGRIQLFIISIGLSLFLRHILLVIFGSRPRPYADYAIQQAVFLGPIAITPRDLVITVVSLVVLVAVGLMLLRTRIGKAMRAVSDDRELAEASGVNAAQVDLYVWMLAADWRRWAGCCSGCPRSWPGTWASACCC